MLEVPARAGTETTDRLRAAEREGLGREITEATEAAADTILSEESHRLLATQEEVVEEDVARHRNQTEEAVEQEGWLS